MIYKYFIIKENDINQRLDNFCKRKIKYIKKNILYSLLRKFKIKVNNLKVNFFYKLQKNDFVKVYTVTSNVNLEKVKCQEKNLILINYLQNYVIYEDEYLLIINKPSGIAVHGGSQINIDIINSFRLLNNNYIELIHRLDKDTSGLLMLAKSKNVLINLQHQFKENLIRKKYIVLVHNIFKKNRFLCIKIKKTSFIKKKMIVDTFGKYSKTFFSIKKLLKKFTLLEAITYSGRTHQIRVHLSFLGHPIVGDNIYGDIEKDKNLSLKRLFLYANYISFLHPIYKKKIILELELDKSLLEFIKMNS